MRAICEAFRVCPDYILFGERGGAERAWELARALPDGEKAGVFLWLLGHFLNE